jgi:hypothetical protein
MELGQLREKLPLYSLDTEFTFGKYRSETIEMVIYEDVKYITWCIENVKDFVLDDKAYKVYNQELSASNLDDDKDDWQFPGAPDHSSYYDD